MQYKIPVTYDRIVDKMARQLRFRAKRSNDPAFPFVEGWLVPFSNRKHFEMWIMSHVSASSTYGWPIDIDTIGQFTGLRDVNGKDVYEGDIVRYRATDARHTKNPRFVNLPIHYSESSAKFEAGNIFWEDLSSERIEVIGNIYDNPELIETQNN